MKEPDRAIGVQGWSAADREQEVHGDGVVTTDPGGAGGTREPSGAEGARSQGRADW